jgi:integrase/recombinase XerD
MQKVQVYIRHSGTRTYEKALPKTIYPLGTLFVLRYTLNGKRHWENLNVQNYGQAVTASLYKQIEVGEIARGEKAAPAPKPRPVSAPKSLSAPENTGPVMLDKAIDRYLANVSTRSDKTTSGYGYTLKQFYASCGNKVLAEIETQQLYDFVGYLRREGLGDRTIHNRVGEIVTFLRHFGIKEVTLRVKYVEKAVRAYRPDELKAIFTVTNPDESLLFQFFLCTGCREQEAMNAEWSDVDFVDCLFTVRAKPGWKPKDYEEREIPIPDFLVAALKKRMLETKGKLMFPTKDGKREGHMLRKLQEIAKRAGLPGEWGLHKFRKTYATLQHRAGVDARTIQKRLGHSDLATTLAYLEGEDARSGRSREQVNGTFGVFAARP